MKKNISKDAFKWALQKLSLILQPFVPHVSEEIWSQISVNGFCINDLLTEESPMRDAVSRFTFS